MNLLTEVFRGLNRHNKPEPNRNRFGVGLTPSGALGLYEYTAGHRGTQIHTPFGYFGLPYNEERQLLEKYFIDGVEIPPEISTILSASAQEAIHLFTTGKCLSDHTNH